MKRTLAGWLQLLAALIPLLGAGYLALMHQAYAVGGCLAAASVLLFFGRQLREKK